MSILAKKLFNKKVMLTDGSELGTVSNVIMDSYTGDLLYLVVKPNTMVDISKYDRQNNYIIIPFEAVKAAKDYALIDEAKISH